MVQYYWTEWHIIHNKVATLVTTRSSGSSYLNRVKLQNGCLSLGHANTFIPSTLGGSSVDLETGKIDENKLKENLNLAISAYISRVDGCPCGETTIKLVRGANLKSQQEMDKCINTYLKGSKKSKEALQVVNPSIYNHIDEVWSVRNRHMVKGLPHNYIFYLKCCYQMGCTHPRCKAKPTITAWFPGGPILSHIPLPIADPDRPWGSFHCKSCKGICAGHYLTVLIDTSKEAEMKMVMIPPSMILKEMFSERDQESSEFSSEFVTNAAKKVLLTTDDVTVWLNHLSEVQKNRKRGAAKAAETRQKKKEKNKCDDLLNRDTDVDQALQQIEKYYCASCGIEYEEDTGSFWICCDKCNRWYCASCENLIVEPQTDTYLCSKCKMRCE